MFGDEGEKHLNSWLLSGTGCLFLIFCRIQSGPQRSPHVPLSLLVALSPWAQHPHMSPHQASDHLCLESSSWEWVWFSPFWGQNSLGFLTCPSAWPSWDSARECSCLPAAFVHVGCSLFWSSQQNNPTLLFFLFYCRHGSTRFYTALLAFQRDSQRKGRKYKCLKQ